MWTVSSYDDRCQALACHAVLPSFVDGASVYVLGKEAKGQGRYFDVSSNLTMLKMALPFPPALDGSPLKSNRKMRLEN